MATAATTTDTRHHNHDGHGTHAVDRKTHGFRSAFLSPLLFWLGSMAWLAGAATHLAVQPRDGYRIGGERRFTAGSALFVAGAGLFVLASLVGLAAAYAEAALVRVGTRTPGLARILILSAWLELLGSIVLLVGSAFYLASRDEPNEDQASAGTILWLIGSFIFLVGILLQTIMALIVAAVTALMAEMLHRQRAWFSIAATIMSMVGWVIFTVGAAAMVVMRGPGFLLFGSLLWLAASGLWVVAGLTRMFGTWYYFAPILSFATAAAAVSSIVAGTAAQPGLVAAHPKADAYSAGAAGGGGAPLNGGNAAATLHTTTTTAATDVRRPSATAAGATAPTIPA